ncbi:UMP kinase [bacterium]|nr:MAG: UMP kinase [bacterium]
MAQYKRILLKLSGELLSGEGRALAASSMANVAAAICEVAGRGIEVAVVVGGGNMLRGRDHQGARSQAEVDQVGMLATVLNVAMLRFHIEDAGRSCAVYAPRPVFPVAAAFERKQAIADLAAGKVVLLGGGTGNPYFSTDSAAALRAIELDCDAVLKGTTVDGVYDKDPNRNDDAVRFDRITHDEAISRGLQVMDQTAFALCRDRSMPVVVFDLRLPQNLVGLIDGTVQGTVVTRD